MALTPGTSDAPTDSEQTTNVIIVTSVFMILIIAERIAQPTPGKQRSIKKGFRSIPLRSRER